MHRISCLIGTALILLGFFVLTASAQTIDPALLNGYETALVIHEQGTDTRIDANPALSARKLSPYSTFKIYNTLIGLELGLIPGADAPWYQWDGVVRELEPWNHDLTLREAFKASCVPAYQQLARQIGPSQMNDFLNKIGYGNKDISGGIDRFWLGSSAVISAREQLALMDRLLNGGLPFSAANIAILKDIMKYTSTDKGTLYGKTGSGRDEAKNPSVGWYVGFLESQGKTYTFACNITGGKEPSGKEARTIVENVFKSLGLL